MNPIDYLSDPWEEIIIVFENDNNKQLTFIKQTTKNKELAMWKKLINDSWKTTEWKN